MVGHLLKGELWTHSTCLLGIIGFFLIIAMFFFGGFVLLDFCGAAAGETPRGRPPFSPVVIPSLKDLLLVDLGCLILHEAHDEDRLARLRERMEAEGEQRNPVIVSPHEDRYLVLDGAHRVRALGELGSRFALVQTVEPPEKAEGWGHLLDGVGRAELGDFGGIEGRRIRRCSPGRGGDRRRRDRTPLGSKRMGCEAGYGRSGICSPSTPRTPSCGAWNPTARSVSPKARP